MRKRKSKRRSYREAREAKRRWTEPNWRAAAPVPEIVELDKARSPYPGETA